MTADQFISEYQGAAYMTRQPITLTMVESTDGYMLVRAEGPADIAYSAARHSIDALGCAASAAAYGDFTHEHAGSFETPEAALEHARWLNTLGPC